MRIKAYFTTDSQKKAIESKLSWWNHFDTYGADILWDKEKDHFLVRGTAACTPMAKELKQEASRVEVEDFKAI